MNDFRSRFIRNKSSSHTLIVLRCYKAHMTVKNKIPKFTIIIKKLEEVDGNKLKRIINFFVKINFMVRYAKMKSF